MANQILSQDNSNEKKKNDEAVENSEKNTQLIIPNVSKEIDKTESEKKINTAIKITGISFFIIFFLCIACLITFSVINNKDNKIKKGVLIEGIEVSELTREEAKKKIQEEFLNILDDTIYLQYGENQYSLALKQIDVQFKLEEAIDKAYKLGREGNIFQQDLDIIKLTRNTQNITIEVEYDEVALDACILDISAKLPEQVEQPSYYIEEGNLIITSGKIGKAAKSDETKEIIIGALNNKNFKEIFYDIPTYDRYPDDIDVEKIYKEIYKEAKDAYYTVEPRVLYPDETGVDFQENLETVKEQIDSEKKDEYIVPLKYSRANITVNDLGTDAFPDQLATTSTIYVNNANRTINLRLAANKINGTVLMPGETFSYNTIVGERTIAAGYKNAAIYENGQVVDGLGGGICQVSTTLYNSVLKSDLEIVERSNHMFLATYAPGGLDATVAYGSLDFKFKNNRNYPIKVIAGIENGYCTVQILGLKTEDDYQIVLTSRKVGALTYQAFKNYYKNGQFIKSELVSTDQYRSH